MQAISTNLPNLKDFQKALTYPMGMPAFLCKLLFINILALLISLESPSLDLSRGVKIT